MKIELLKITEVKPYWRNPRKNDKAVEALKQSIEAYGFNVPIVVDKEKVIIAGHTRYLAMLQMGASEIPCNVIDISKQKAKAYRIADNKTAELANWDIDKLIQEMKELNEDIMAEMQFFFEEDLKGLVETKTSEIKAVTEEALRQSDADQATQFKKREEEHRQKLQMVTCPHCGEMFQIE